MGHLVPCDKTCINRCLANNFGCSSASNRERQLSSKCPFLLLLWWICCCRLFDVTLKERSLSVSGYRFLPLYTLLWLSIQACPAFHKIMPLNNLYIDLNIDDCVPRIAHMEDLVLINKDIQNYLQYCTLLDITHVLDVGQMISIFLFTAQVINQLTFHGCFKIPWLSIVPIGQLFSLKVPLIICFGKPLT